MARKVTHTEFIECCNISSPQIEILGDYINAKSKVLCRCRKCNNEWFSNADLLKRGGAGCPVCRSKALSKRCLKSYNDFILDVTENNNNIDIIEYPIHNVGKKIKCKCRCRICNNEWVADSYSISKGKTGCPKCYSDKRKYCKVMSYDDFIRLANENSHNISVIGEYTKAKDKIECRCNVCGYEFKTQASRVVNGNAGCQRCKADRLSKLNRKTHEQFLEELSLVNIDVEVLSKYNTNNTYIKCKCTVCNHIYNVKPINILSGRRCPACNESKGERQIKTFLSNLDYTPQKEFYGLVGVGGKPLSYDFYIPSYNLLIEYQGEFHDGTAYQQTDKQFKIQQEHDRRKKQYAIDNNIKLLEIWYWDYNNIEEILKKELIK